MHAKTGIASRLLKPTLGILDPENTLTMPRQVAASSGLDILSHAIESYTALPFAQRPAPERPSKRPAQGSNPISDIWALQALRIVSEFLVRAVDDPSDSEARANMLLAASYAGVGFGNAGVHLPHGMSYAVSGHVRTYQSLGYPADHPLVPHGYFSHPERASRFPLYCLCSSGAAPTGRRGAGRRRVTLSRRGCRASTCGPNYMVHAELNVPNGLREIGYTPADIPALIEGTLPQHRVTKLLPRPAGPDELSKMFEEAMVAW